MDQPNHGVIGWHIIYCMLWHCYISWSPRKIVFIYGLRQMQPQGHIKIDYLVRLISIQKFWNTAAQTAKISFLRNHRSSWMFKCRAWNSVNGAEPGEKWLLKWVVRGNLSSGSSKAWENGLSLQLMLCQTAMDAIHCRTLQLSLVRLPVSDSCVVQSNITRAETPKQSEWERDGCLVLSLLALLWVVILWLPLGWISVYIPVPVL